MISLSIYLCTFFIWRTCKLFANSGFMRNIPISSIQPQSSQELNSGVCYKVGFQYLLKISCGVCGVCFTQCVTNVQCTECFSLTCVLSDCFHCPKHHSLLQPPIFLSHTPHFQWHLLHVELSGQYSNPKDNANGKCMFSKKAACLQILTLPLNNLSTDFNALLFHKLNLQSGVMYKFIEHSGVPIFKIHKDISTLQN